MSDTLKDQLLGLGFKPAPKPERKPEPRRDTRRDPKATGKPQSSNRGGAQGARDAGNRGSNAKPASPNRGKPRSQEDIDLAKAYAIRAQKEKDERMAAEAAKQEAARVRREAKAKFDEFIKDKSLNVADAEIARHFEYGGKIKRIYVTAEQLKALNGGELGVVQQNGRYLLVTAEVLQQAEAIFAQGVALRVDPNATAEEDPYADPQYQIPDDLVW
jgi:uncharacterized protein YaiL (DUF2058 family)